MAFDRLGGILADLLIFAQSFTGYSIPSELPEIAFVPHVELQRSACDRPCEVYGWYPLGRTIYLDDRLDPIRDAKARSILLHELVHYLPECAPGLQRPDGMPQLGPARTPGLLDPGPLVVAQQHVTAMPFMGPGPAPWTLACRRAGTGD